jgi:hypothetical protein
MTTVTYFMPLSELFVSDKSCAQLYCVFCVYLFLYPPEFDSPVSFIPFSLDVYPTVLKVVFMAMDFA